jgi:tetratricopeptide (TPR) repeat protein
LTARAALPKRGAALGVVLAALALGACAGHAPLPAPLPSGAPGGVLVPGSPAAAGGPQTPAPAPSPPPSATRQFHLGLAASALVTQARNQAGAGEYPAAGATLERALRIEPDNPLLWIELGRVQMGQGNPEQADGMGHKALALATGDPLAQSSAWRLIADSLQARGRAADALEAERRAESLSPQ